MSSSQKQPPDSNEQRSQSTNSQFPAVDSRLMDDYMDDESLPSTNTSNFNDQSATGNSGDFYDPTQQGYYNDNPSDSNAYAGDDDQDNENLDEIEAELTADEIRRHTYQGYENEDDPCYSDEVQKAFEQYEANYSSYWLPTDSTWNNFSSTEQDNIFAEMRECMVFMEQEYSTAEMPEALIDRSQSSQLNADATEFRPSWISPSNTTTATTAHSIHVTSWVPCVATKQDKEEPQNA